MQEPRYLKTAEEMTLEEPGVHGDTAWMSREDAGYLSQLAKAARASIEVVDTLGDAQGTYDPKTGRIRIAKDATDPVGFVTQHELTHRIRDNAPQQWGQFLDYVQKHYGEDWNSVLEGYQRRYAEHDIELTAEEAAEEAAADFAGRMNESDIRRLTQENRSLAQKILDAIRDLIRKLKGGENQKLYEMEKLWASALKEGNKNTANEGGVRYRIGKTTENRPFVEVEDDILDGVSEGKWVSTVKKNLKERFPNGIAIGNNVINIDKESRKEMTFSGYMQWLYNVDPQLRKDKLRATDNADEILRATTGWVNEGQNHARKDKIVDFARGNVLLRIGENDYVADVLAGTKKDGRMIMYDVLDLRPTSFAEKETNAAKTENPSPGAGRNTASVSNSSIRYSAAKSNPQNAEKTKKSLKSDSRGRALTAAQQEYFADSQVLDKSGKLLPVYHTTYDEFTTFDRNRLGAVTDGNATDETMAATAHIGFWFNTQDLRKAYGSRSRAEEVYLNITNPLKLNSLDELYNYVSLYGGDGSATEMGEATAEALRDYGYDGIALRDEEFGGTSYVALEPEQIKRVTNESPTSDPDMRRSLKGSKEAAEEIERLREQNKRLTQELTALKSAIEMGVGISTDYKSAAKAAEEMRKRFGSKADQTELTEALLDLYDGMAAGTLSNQEMRDLARRAADTVIDGAEGNVNPLYEEYAALHKELRTEKVTLPKENRADIQEGYNALRKRAMGSVKIGNDGIPVDVRYEALSEQYPELFPDDILNPADQLERMVDVAESLKKTNKLVVG